MADNIIDIDEVSKIVTDLMDSYKEIVLDPTIEKSMAHFHCSVVNILNDCQENIFKAYDEFFDLVLLDCGLSHKEKKKIIFTSIVENTLFESEKKIIDEYFKSMKSKSKMFIPISDKEFLSAFLNCKVDNIYSDSLNKFKSHPSYIYNPNSNTPSYKSLMSRMIKSTKQKDKKNSWDRFMR